MKKTLACISTIIVILGVFVIVRYNTVNLNIPKNYKLDAYSLNEELILDDMSIKVNDYKVYERDTLIDGDNHFEITLKVSVKNITKGVINLSNLLIKDKISYKTYYQDYSDVEGDYSKIRNLKPQESTDLEIKYLLFRDEIEQLGAGGKLRFYPPKNSFKNQIINEYNNGYLYGKYVELGE